MNKELNLSETKQLEISTKNKILVVDDEPGWREWLSYELTPKGNEIVSASNASEGLACLEQQSFDLVITDVRMPGPMDGIDLIEAHRRMKPSQKVIFITGYAADEKLEKALESGCCRCLKKPFDIDQLFHEIQSLLQHEG